MKVLLDTHAILWVLGNDPRLSQVAKNTYEQTDQVYFSMVSLWEIGIKLGLNRTDFSLAENWWKAIPQTLTRQGVVRLNIEPVLCSRVSELPLHHRDPFDRLLIVQVQELKASLLSCDSQFDEYQVKRLW